MTEERRCLVWDSIYDLAIAAKRLGIQRRRIYIGPVKKAQLEEELRLLYAGPVADEMRSSQTVLGMKVVDSKNPGISIGP